MDSTTMTPADIHAVTGNNGGFGDSGIWLFALLILFGMGGFGFGGNKQTTPTDYARQSDVVYTSAFNQLQDENTGIRSEIQRVGYDTMANIKDGLYNNLSEIRDLESSVANGFSNMQKCCCETQKEILSNRYENAINTANINATSTANTQKILDKLAENEAQALRDKVSNLELQLATASNVKYPTTSAWAMNGNPFCGFTGGY